MLLQDEAWRCIRRDLRDQGVDLYDPSHMSRPWLWLRDAILGLIDRPSGFAPDGYSSFTTRIQQHFYGPVIAGMRKADEAKAKAEADRNRRR